MARQSFSDWDKQQREKYTGSGSTSTQSGQQSTQSKQSSGRQSFSEWDKQQRNKQNAGSANAPSVMKEARADGLKFSSQIPGAKSSPYAEAWRTPLDQLAAENKADRQMKQAQRSVISFNGDGTINADQTALNAAAGMKKLGAAAAPDNTRYSDAYNKAVMDEYKARGGTTLFGLALNAKLYNQIDEELSRNYEPVSYTKDRAEIPEYMTREGITRNAQSAREIADEYGAGTAYIDGSDTQRNALDFAQRYQDMGFGEKMLHTAGNAALNYGLDFASAGLTAADALSGGRLGRGDGKASSIYSMLNFAQNAGSGLAGEAFGNMRESSNWLGKIVLDLERTTVEQTLDRLTGMGAGSLVPMGIRVFGSGSQEAENEGKSIGKRVLTGLVRGGIEVGTEKMSGIGGSWRGTGYGDAVFNSLDRWVANKTNSELLGTLSQAFGSEAVEEMMSDVLNPIADRIFKLSNGDTSFLADVWGDGQLLYDGLLGGLAGLGGGGETYLRTGATARNMGIDIATYKAAQRITESDALRRKFEEYTGTELSDDADTAITQAAVLLTNEQADTEGTNARDIERYAREGRRTAEGETQEAQQYPQGTQEETPEWARQTPQELYRDIEKNEPEFFRDMVELKGMRPDVPRGRFDGRTGQQIEEDPAEWKRYDARRKELEEKYGADRVWAIDAVLEDGITPAQQTAQQAQQAAQYPQGTRNQQATQYPQGTQGTQNTRRPDGILEAAYRGEVGQIKAIVQDGGKFTARVQMPDGRTRDVTEDKLTFDAETQKMLDSVRPYAYGDEMLLSYRPEDNGGDFDTYVRAYTTAADMYGKQTAVTAQQAYESSRRNGGAGSVLTQEQFMKAFNTGRSSKDARIQNSAARQRGEGKVYFGQDVDYGGERYKAASEDMVSGAELDVIKTLAKITGTDVVFYQSEADMSGRYKGANGFMRNGTMYLDVNAGANRTSEESAVLLTAAHELTHYIRENNAEGYAQLRDFVTRHLIEDGVDIEALAEQKAARENGLLSMDEAVEEVIADSCEMMLEDTQLPEIMAKENPGLYEQIREWIANFAEKLRKAFTGVEARHAEAKAMMKYADELSRIWDSALAGAVRNTEAASGTETSGNAKYSLREYSEEQKENWAHSKRIVIYSDEAHLRQFIRDARENKNSEKKMYFGRVPANMAEEVLKNTGLDIDGFNCSLSAYEIQKIFKDHGKQSTEGPRGQRAITEDDIVSIPDILQNADQIKLSPKLYNGKPVINFTAIGNDRVTVTAYVSDKHLDLAVQTMFANIKKGNLATLTDEQASVDTPEAGRGTVSNNTIPQSDAESNTKYSMRERDDAADVKTAEKYFGTTYKIAEAGYLLRDGKLLDMSGRHEGAPGGYRTVDHRDITDAFDGDYGDGSYSGGMVQFMQAGNIRLSPESGGINLSTKPNAKQLDVLDRYISSFRGEVTLDIDNANGDTVVSIEYPKRTYSKRIINDINEYFDNGTVPEQPSDLGQFRYSMRDVAEDDTADERRGRQESYAELRRQNEELRRRAEYWKGQTRTTKEATVRKADTDALARRLAEELHNKDAEDTVKEELKRMGDYIVQTDGQELSYAELKDWASAIADHILSGSEAEIESGMEDARRELLDYLKSNKLKINEREMLDLPEGWKREHRRIRFGKDGLPIDTAWMELQEKFGEGAFPSTITSQSDMLFHIADMERAWQPVRGNPFENYMGEMRETVAQDILDTMLSDEIRQTAKTAADRARDRMNKAVAEERTRYNDMKSRMQERIQQVYQEGVARKQEAVAKEKAAKWEKVEQTRNYYQQMMQNAQQRRRENAGIKKYKDSVTATAAQLTDWMLNNSAKEHVPEVLKKTVGDFLTTIDFTSRQQLRGGEETANDRKFASKLSALRDVLENQQKYMSGADTESALDVYIDMPSDMMEQVKDFIRIANKFAETGKTFTVNDMTAEELRHLDTLLTVLSTSVKKTNQLMANSRYRSVQQASQNSIEELGKLGKQGKAAKTGLAAFGFWDNTTPFYAFQRFGEGGKAIFEGISKGWEQMAFNAKKIIDFTEKLYTAKEARTWREETHEVKFENGDKFTITTAQLMSLHCLRKRAQAIGHLYGGGLRVGNIGKGLNEIVQTEHFKPNSADLEMLDGMLTERQREVADALQHFMVDTCGEWGNEVSMKRFGYRGFGEKNYFPIQTDSNDRPAVDPDAKANDMFRLLNLSATKALTINANNALVVSDIFEVFTDHSSDMAKYNALALPILDALKWYNYKERTNVNGLVYTDTVQRSVETAYGRAAQKYVVTLLKDLNGKHEGGTSRSDAVTKRMVSNYKAAAVGANLRVAIQQPTAYVRAAQEIDAKYLAAALKPGSGKQSSEEMNRYSGIATWKGLGFVSTDIGRSMRSQIMHDESLADVAKEKAMFFAEKGDAVTWAALWRACRMETADLTKLRGDELCKATAERFREVILKTQVVDATITRSHNMRNQGILANITTSFMAEPTLSYNILLNAYADYRADMRKAGGSSKQKAAIAWQKNKGAIVKSMAVFVASSAATVLAASLWDAVRDDDDYETFAQKLKQALFGEEGNWMEGNLMQELLIYNKIPVIKDIAAIFRGEDVSRMDMQAITNLKKAWDIDMKMLSMALGAKDGEKAVSYNGQLTAYGVLAANLRAVSQLSGLPFYNAMRDAVALYNTVVAPFSGVTVQSYRPTTRAAIKSSYLNGFMSDEDAMAELVKQGVADDADQAFWIINDWNGDGSSNDKLEELYAAVKAGDTESYDALMQELTEHGVFKNKIQNNVKNQVRDWYQGSDTERATISKQEALELLQKYGGKAEHDADVAVEQWTCEKVTGIAYGNIGDEFINGNISESRALELQAKYGYGDTSRQTAAEIAANKELAQAKVMQWKLEKDTGIDAGGDSFTGIRDAYDAGRISKEEVYEYRIKYAGDTPEAAANTAYRYEWIGGETAMKSITGKQAQRYDSYVAGSGISKLDYWNIINGHSASTFKSDYNSKGKVIANSKRDKLWAYIDSLSLTPEQKDKIAMVYFDDVGTKSWAKLEEAPWNS